jgi:hypothetical protein
MKEPKRLLSHGATDFERQLLRAVVSERPSALLRSRMQRGLGLVGPLAWASNVKAVFGTVTSRTVAGVAVVGVVVVSGFAAVRLVPSSNEEDIAVASAPLQAPPMQAPSMHVLGSAEPSGPEASAPQVHAVAAPAPTSPSPVAIELAVPNHAAMPTAAVESPGATDDDGRLREEIALLDAARAALQHGDRRSARASLSVYRERFPNGVLRREANVLRRRVEAKGAE